MQEQSAVNLRAMGSAGLSDQTPTTDPAPLDLDAAEQRAHYYGLLCHQIGNSTAPDLLRAAYAAADDAGPLVARVRQLEALLETQRGIANQLKAERDHELAEAERERDAARRELAELRARIDEPGAYAPGVVI